MTHKTVRVQYGDLEADIDVKMAPLILECWKAGVRTSYCCQSNPCNWAYISFETSYDFRKFVDLIIKFDSARKSLYCRVIGLAKAHNWIYNFNVVDYNCDRWYDKEAGVAHLDQLDADKGIETDISSCVRFYKTDLPILTEAMTRYNKLAEQAAEEQRQRYMKSTGRMVKFGGAKHE